VVPTLATVRAVVVTLVDVSEAGRFELCVFHRGTLSPIACEHPLDNSYSSRRLSTLYGVTKSSLDFSRDAPADLLPWSPTLEPAPNFHGHRIHDIEVHRSTARECRGAV
jgi:hypothetical protein